MNWPVCYLSWLWVVCLMMLWIVEILCCVVVECRYFLCDVQQSVRSSTGDWTDEWQVFGWQSSTTEGNALRIANISVPLHSCIKKALNCLNKKSDWVVRTAPFQLHKATSSVLVRSTRFSASSNQPTKLIWSPLPGYGTLHHRILWTCGYARGLFVFNRSFPQSPGQCDNYTLSRTDGGTTCLVWICLDM